MANRGQTLKQHGIRNDTVRLDEKVGEVLAIYEVTRADSQRFGVGFDVRYNVLADVETGEVRETDVRSVTFALPMVRDLRRIVGDSYEPYTFSPPLVVRLVQLDKTFGMADLEEG